MDKNCEQIHKLSLKGSAKTVAEFRGVYPAEDFIPVKKYGLNMLVSSDDQVKAYVKKIMQQLDRWMQHGKITRLVIVITRKDTGEPVERWEFQVHLVENVPLLHPMTEHTAQKGSENAQILQSSSRADEALIIRSQAVQKSEKQIQAEIAAIFRQITASVTFLPQLDTGACTFNVLVYADADSDVPIEWEDSDAKDIVGGEKVQLRGFSTSRHAVGTTVEYKVGDIE